MDCPQQRGPGLVVEGDDHRGRRQGPVVVLELSAAAAGEGDQLVGVRKVSGRRVDNQAASWCIKVNICKPNNSLRYSKTAHLLLKKNLHL